MKEYMILADEPVKLTVIMKDGCTSSTQYYSGNGQLFCSTGRDVLVATAWNRNGDCVGIVQPGSKSYLDFRDRTETSGGTETTCKRSEKQLTNWDSS